jgi:hypothetical protein
MHRKLVLPLVLVLAVAVSPPVIAGPVNLALNTSHAGLPSPLESDPGWGGGSYPWDIVDGLRGYSDTWAHGLALAWDGQAHQSTIAFADAYWFNQVILVYDSYYPVTPPLLDYWDGTGWNGITYSRTIGGIPIGTTWGGPSDVYDFDMVYGSKVRWTVPAGATFCDDCPNHAWIYEFEVYNTPDLGSSLLLLGLGLVGLRAWKRRVG